MKLYGGATIIRIGMDDLCCKTYEPFEPETLNNIICKVWDDTYVSYHAAKKELWYFCKVAEQYFNEKLQIQDQLYLRDAYEIFGLKPLNPIEVYNIFGWKKEQGKYLRIDIVSDDRIYIMGEGLPTDNIILQFIPNIKHSWTEIS